MSQLTYAEQPLGFEGDLADLSIKDVVRGAAEVEIAPGRALVRGTDPDKQWKLAETGETPVAISLRDLTKENNTSGVQVFDIGEQVPGLEMGRAFVKPIVAVDYGDPVYFVIADATFSNVVGSGGTTAELITGWKFKKTTSAANQISIIEVVK